MFFYPRSCSNYIPYCIIVSLFHYCLTTLEIWLVRPRMSPKPPEILVHLLLLTRLSDKAGEKVSCGHLPEMTKVYMVRYGNLEVKVSRRNPANLQPQNKLDPLKRKKELIPLMEREMRKVRKKSRRKQNLPQRRRPTRGRLRKVLANRLRPKKSLSL